jgi:beta-lactamase class A
MDGTIGAAAIHLESGKRVSMRGDEPFPMASVCKVPIAMQILAMSSSGKLSLDDDVEIPRYDVWPGVSRVAELWPKQTKFRLHRLVEWMVAQSDNTAVQTLFRLAGSAEGMASRFREWKITGIRLDRSERQCGFDAVGITNVPPITEWTPGMEARLRSTVPPEQRLAALRRFMNDPRDTATPDATVDLLQRLYRDDLLSSALARRLILIMESTTTGPRRIKGLLPAGTRVAHKTGTSATESGLNASTNDMGVITLPNGKGRLALAVYVKGSSRDLAIRERAIAKIAKAAFDSMGDLA